LVILIVMVWSAVWFHLLSKPWMKFVVVCNLLLAWLRRLLLRMWRLIWM
jgi:hypothetical protein